MENKKISNKLVLESTVFHSYTRGRLPLPTVMQRKHSQSILNRDWFHPNAETEEHYLESVVVLSSTRFRHGFKEKQHQSELSQKLQNSQNTALRADTVENPLFSINAILNSSSTAENSSISNRQMRKHSSMNPSQNSHRVPQQCTRSPLLYST